MRRVLPVMIALLLVALASVGALPARAAVEVPTGPVVAGVPGPAGVRAGDVVELRWRLDDPAVEELELELSVDGGPWRRISPELPGLTSRFEWRVPALGATHARLRLRVGTRDGEYDLPPSEPFAIHDDAAVARPLAAAPLSGSRELPGALRDSRPGFTAHAADQAADAPTRVALPTSSAGPVVELLHHRAVTDGAPAGPAGRQPRFVPLRN